MKGEDERSGSGRPLSTLKGEIKFSVFGFVLYGSHVLLCNITYFKYMVDAFIHGAVIKKTKAKRIL